MPKVTEKRGAEILDFTYGGWTLRIAPRHGASIVACKHEGLDILRPAPQDWLTRANIFDVSHFPLAPYSNRIENGKFSFKGQRHHIISDQEDDPHALHGLAWHAAWEVTDTSQNQITLATRHMHPNKSWPWRFSLVHKIQASAGALELKLSMTNEDTDPMPSGLGFHPYFANTLQAELEFKAANVWIAGDDKIPNALRPIPESLNFSSQKPALGIDIDNCFGGLQLPAFLSWRDRQRKIRIDGSTNLKFAVIYSDSETGSLCFEPVTHMNNGVNWMDKNVETGVKILNPGETQHVSMILTLEDN